MASTNNGAVAKIIAGVVSALLIFIILQVIGNTSRITAVETDMAYLKQSLRDSRQENREEHQAITAKLDAIKEYVKK
jgi:hypothetical protein